MFQIVFEVVKSQALTFFYYILQIGIPGWGSFIFYWIWPQKRMVGAVKPMTFS